MTADQNPPDCPETIYPRKLFATGIGSTNFVMGYAISDPATGDYVVKGKLSTTVHTPAINHHAIISHNRNGQQHYMYYI